MPLAVFENYSYVKKQLINANYDYIYLSPHLDDAAFSCSGAICLHKSQGLRILVITLFGGDPHPPFSPLVQIFHQFWQVPEGTSPYSTRKPEDEKAMMRLGVDYAWLNWLDLIYRIPNLSDFSAINSYATTFPHDPAFPILQQWLKDLFAAYPRATIVAPPGIGGHHDHRLVFYAVLNALDTTSVLFFEDFPYAAYHPEESTELAKLHNLIPFEVDISHALKQRISITSLYQSQHTMLFFPPDSFPDVINQYTRKEGEPYWIERYWKHPGALTSYEEFSGRIIAPFP